MNLNTKTAGILNNNWFLFCALLSLAMLNTFVYQTSVLTREVYTNLMSETIDAKRIDEYFDMMTRLSVWNYLLLPVFLLLRLCFVALLVQVPFVLKFIDIPFARMLKIIMVAAIPLLLGGLIRTIWMLKLPASEISREALTFVPFSIAVFFESNELSSDILAILSPFNIFEFAWIVILAMGLTRISKIQKSDAALLVLAVWTLIFVFQWILTMYLKRVFG